MYGGVWSDGEWWEGVGSEGLYEVFESRDELLKVVGMSMEWWRVVMAMIEMIWMGWIPFDMSNMTLMSVEVTECMWLLHASPHAGLHIIPLNAANTLNHTSYTIHAFNTLHIKHTTLYTKNQTLHTTH